MVKQGFPLGRKHMRIVKISAGLIKGLTTQRRLQLIAKKESPKLESITSPEEARSAKINELRSKVLSGTYQINFDELAAKILDKEISS
jgi:anti-sigma28 factor (negative regulator of flagellin synthesis)